MDNPRQPNLVGIVIGLIISALGVAILLDRMGIVAIFGMHVVNFWPLLIICFGLLHLLKERPDGRREGGWWVFLGVWLLLNDMGVLRYRTSWPLFLVAIGVSIVWNAMFARSRHADTKAG
jgi:hypothetical protein